jgi:hypothetical protein
MPTSMPVCRRIRAAREAMPASAMIAAGGPITRSKHIQANQDAAAMNVSRNGSEAAASPQIRKRSAGGEAWRARQAGVAIASAAIRAWPSVHFLGSSLEAMPIFSWRWQRRIALPATYDRRLGAV